MRVFVCVCVWLVYLQIGRALSADWTISSFEIKPDYAGVFRYSMLSVSW